MCLLHSPLHPYYSLHCSPLLHCVPPHTLLTLFHSSSNRQVVIGATWAMWLCAQTQRLWCVGCVRSEPLSCEGLDGMGRRPQQSNESPSWGPASALPYSTLPPLSLPAKQPVIALSPLPPPGLPPPPPMGSPYIATPHQGTGFQILSVEWSPLNKKLTCQKKEIGFQWN